MKLGIITYGSLMKQQELEKIFDNPLERTTKIKLYNYKRIFNQKATWRDKNKGSTVLNVQNSEDNWVNCILLQNITGKELEKYKEREQGYSLQEIEVPDITAYDNKITIKQNKILIPKGNKTTGKHNPIPEYVNICIDGARQWGDQFYEDFLKTTYINNKTLKEYNEY